MLKVKAGMFTQILNRYYSKYLILYAVAFIAGCKQPDRKILSDPDLIHRNMENLTTVIVNDVFSPPVASRIYVYTSLAAYEAIRFDHEGYPSIVEQLKGFPRMPQPEKEKSYNFFLAASQAFYSVAGKIATISKDSLDKRYYTALFDQFESLLDKDIFERSILFGEMVANKILERSRQDNYKKTRGMPKYIGNHEAGKWRPTPPDYLDGAEPYWGMIAPMCMDSALHFKPAAPPLYSIDSNSSFYKSVYEVYNIGKNLTEEQKTIARYWDDNPFVMEHSGHMMFGNKKITPVGHWMGITTIACKKKGTGPIETAQAYAITSIAMFDSFISCWEEKYRTQLVRPVTVINESIDRNWQPFLQTPPFPEHTSGHSSISAAAATVLTNRFGDNFAFEDTSDLKYIGMKRNFNSFLQAAMEASISRVYGGIHFRTGVEEGTKQGLMIGQYINKKIRLRE